MAWLADDEKVSRVGIGAERFIPASFAHILDQGADLIASAGKRAMVLESQANPSIVCINGGFGEALNDVFASLIERDRLAHVSGENTNDLRAVAQCFVHTELDLLQILLPLDGVVLGEVVRY